MKISEIHAYQIFDSRGNPTLEVALTLDDGTVGYGLVPSGASTGRFEAHELRDGDPSRFLGRAVGQAIANVEGEIASTVAGLRADDQAALDQTMIQLDGTEYRDRLGANAILGVSLAAADACARSRGVPLYHYLGDGKGDLLPLPEIQIIGGGAHARWRIDIQDFLVIAVGASRYEQTLEMTFNVYHQAGELLAEQDRIAGIADEGGYWPAFDSNEEPLELLVQAIEAAGYSPGEDIAISLDIAASDLYRDGAYRLDLEGRSLSSDDFADLVLDWCERYPVISVEDPLADTDWTGWERFRKAAPSGLQIIGDDLFTTNINRIRRGIDAGIANAVLIKLNQIGTVTETIQAVRTTREAGWLPVISARSGETEDAFITHLAVATNAGQLKVGSFQRSERMVKWNEGIRIGRSLGDNARFIGGDIYRTIT